MKDIQRNVFGTLWNTYSFLSTYAEIDEWQAPKTLARPTSDNVLDKWMLARLDETILQMTEAADTYALAQTLRPLRLLIDDLSNWYVRRSRRRFWKSEDDSDKQNAYVTLHYVLARIAQLLAPWSPFVSDKLWRELTAGTDEPDSVHLSDWPVAGEVDTDVLEKMTLTRKIVEHGLALRMVSTDIQVQVKVRQPLSLLTYDGQKLDHDFEKIIADEVNVKRVDNAYPDDKVLKVHLDKNVTPELKAEGMMRDVVRHVQTARKAAGLEVDDRIELTLITDSTDLAAAIAAHAAVIQTETLATKLETTGTASEVPVKVDGAELYIAVRKA
jgi:isoleucyl-tRNA synthetase